MPLYIKPVFMFKLYFIYRPKLTYYTNKVYLKSFYCTLY